jgi:hypothetical protein
MYYFTSHIFPQFSYKSLKKWIISLLYNFRSQHNSWMNAVNHYSGDHSNYLFEHIGREKHMDWTSIE